MNTEALGRKALTDILRNRVGLKQSYTSQLVTGAKSPSLDLALRIEETAGIPPGVWRRIDTRGATMWAILMGHRDDRAG